MKKTIFALIAIILTSSIYSQQNEVETTVYYLIRHAEKNTTDSKDRNPDLTKQGMERANKWAEILGAIKLDAVYSTDYTRTRLTAIPSAKVNNIELTLYDPRKLGLSEFKADTKGKTTLIVGHSNSTPKLTNALLGEKLYKQIDELVYGNLYIVTIIGNKVNSQLLQIN